MHRADLVSHVVVASILIALGSFPAAAVTPLPAGAHIVAVTVFPDRAEVVREARVELPAGTSRWEFSRLPWGVEQDSFQVSASGVPCRIGAVDLGERAHEPAETPDLTSARAEVRRIEEEIARLDAESQVAATLRSLLDAAAASATPRPNAEAASLGPAALQATYGVLKSRLSRLADERVARAARQRELDEELDLARARMASARPAGATRSRTAWVEVRAERPGYLVLRVSYVTPGASWTPSYRAELAADSSELVLASEAEVRQSTGEDWSGVALTLSTANPSRVVRPPDLPSRFLRVLTDPSKLRLDGANGVDGDGTSGTFGANLSLESIAEIEIITTGVDAELRSPQGGFGLPILGRSQQDNFALSAGITDTEPVTGPATLSTAALAGTAHNVSFQVPGAADVPSDGTSRRVALRMETIPVELRHRSVPALSQAAYLVATARAARDYPVLPGPVRVLVDGRYRGRFEVEEIAADGDLILPFGVDRSIQVKRVQLPGERERTGLAGRNERVAFAYRTTVRNLRAEPATVVLEERVPVSEDERIRVEIDGETTEGGVEDPDRPGIYEWSLKLGPGEERPVTVAWTLRAPRGTVIAGVTPR